VFVDKNNTQMGVVECLRPTDNATLMHFNVYGANGAWASQPLQLRVEDNGTAVAYAPASAAINSIVTTKAISKSANGYVKLGNGLIIQWMLTSNITRSGTVITFPTPFTTENYAICFNPYRSEPLNENATTVTERTASNCKVYGKTYDSGDMNCPCFVLAIGY
jgi:hypothetical protein